MVAFIFRGGLVDGFDYRDMEQHKRIVAEAYAGIGWRAPELVQRVQETDDLYFDSYTLAEALGDGGFDRYEAEHRKLVEPKQKRVAQAAGLIVPKTRTGIAVRNLVAKVWPGGL